jgi:hypothetical protein
MSAYDRANPCATNDSLLLATTYRQELTQNDDTIFCAGWRASPIARRNSKKLKLAFKQGILPCQQSRKIFSNCILMSRKNLENIGNVR